MSDTTPSAGTDERTHWVRWHDDYEDPSSALSWRLGVVRSRLAGALDAAHPGPVRLLSLCAGQGRDVIGVLRDHPRAADVQAVLVESDPANCAYAEQQVAEHGLDGIRVVRGDAALTATVRDAVPADVLLLCGIFGNISDADVELTVRNASRLCAPGAVVVWTRHTRAPDLTVAIRNWFEASGFRLIAFDTRPHDHGAVGTHRLTAAPLPFDPRRRLFTFLR